MKAAALIIAAGKTSHQEVFLPLQKVGSVSAAQRVVNTFLRAGVETTVLVADPAEDKLEKHLGQAGTTVLRNRKNGAQMFDSIKLGLLHLEGQCDTVLITPVNIPLFSADTVRALLAVRKDLVNPVYQGRKGHPLLLDAALIPQILSYRGDQGMRGAIKSCGVQPAQVAVDDPAILLNVEQVEDYEDIMAAHGLHQMRPVLKLRIAKDVPFFGPGCRDLLQWIEREGSVRLACQKMDISYSKGWKMLKVLEEQVGYTVVERQQGGKSGGEAHLSARGKAFLQRYQQFEARCREAVENLFGEFFIGAE